ncbi:hypothetical protein NGH74_01950 [Staphylococcus pseudoxylosus]|uniref:hypothetical protein n=1 Tax=Staphylococcus pseudoxylosus TaxID=2282419 RepID=UPI0018ED2309|nr:hypothetical protein [Staphylococcus pseudoxylosus]MDW8797526.1 hypothetical protein [Staphylococcus pseudoxylosus]MEB6036573.1 hypothetical protein [Staphylococcus pseudoxylosus]MEB6044344.1 hypothetical protein [Staphylococcus pseudoxylosus]MEB7754600.1 hypothetical protein [Staphylococcus pseudoxylosus]MEB7763491.1 hypothetical protein [Staphylococcus pseudoxylosus]
MKSLHELFSELEHWENHVPNNMMSNIAKREHIKNLKREIFARIDIHNYKAIILEKEL